jgi:hypothetical protein
MALHHTIPCFAYLVVGAILSLTAASMAQGHTSRNELAVQAPTTKPTSSSGQARTLPISELTAQLRLAVGIGEEGDALRWANRLIARDPDDLYARGVRSTFDGPPALGGIARKLPVVQFDEVALSDVMDFMHDISGCNLVVDWDALKVRGINRDTPISGTLKDVTFRQALRIVLDNAARGGTPLGLIREGGTLTVSTQAEIKSKLIKRVYSVRDLLEGSHSRDINQIMDLVRRSAPDAWNEKTSVRYKNGQLTVTQTIDNQFVIAGLLDMLRSIKTNPNRGVGWRSGVS